MIDVWFDFNVGNIHINDDGGTNYHVKSRGTHRVTYDSNLTSVEDLRKELHAQLDRAINLHLETK